MSSDTILTIYSIISGAAILYLAFRKAPEERRQLSSQATKDMADAQEIIAGLNSKYLNEIENLKRMIEAPKKYQVIVEFETCFPPKVDRVEINLSKTILDKVNNKKP